jgi:hypothetical protein
MPLVQLNVHCLLYDVPALSLLLPFSPANLDLVPSYCLPAVRDSSLLTPVVPGPTSITRTLSVNA